MTVLEWARRYVVERGWSVVPIPRGEKAPHLKGWQDLRLTESDLPRYFTDDGNIGALLGEPSGGLTDVDLDVPEALAVAREFLPRTELIHGRPSKPASHWWYCVCPPTPKLRRLRDLDGACLVELRSTGGQTVIPPSVHPSGEAITWVADGEPARVEAAALRAAVARVAACALLVRHWPEKGSRHDCALALAGFLVRHGVDEEMILTIVTTVARAAGEDDHRRDVLDTIRAFKSGRQITGGVALATLLRDGVKAVRLLSEWLSLARINATHDQAENEGHGGKPSASPWSTARPAPDFVNTPEPELQWLAEPLLAPGTVTIWFSPRGLGKSLAANYSAVKLAKEGKRVLLLDRDNPPRELKHRLAMWGASGGESSSLKVMVRDKVPPLTDARAWASFPLRHYDAVIIDSLDASTEGVGEQDSARPSRAFAALLDVARQPGGPAILVLANTIKSGAHGRGSGVIEDRADIVYEVRDATDFTPSGRRAWWLELPPADRGSWGQRAARRKRRSRYRLAFVPSKFRVAEEPEPFVLEIDLSTEPWTLRDATADLLHAGEAARAAAERDRQARVETAVAALKAEVIEKARAGQPVLLSRDAVPFLTAHGLTRAEAREVIPERDGRNWSLKLAPGQRGRPVGLYPVDEPGGDSGEDGGTNPGDGSHAKQKPNLGGISADHMDTGRQKSLLTNPAPDAGIRDPRLFPPAASKPPSWVPGEPCPACHGYRWWRSIHGPVVCHTCHPPPIPELVAAEWDAGSS